VGSAQSLCKQFKLATAQERHPVSTGEMPSIRTQLEINESQTVREWLLAMLDLSFFAVVALLVVGDGYVRRTEGHKLVALPLARSFQPRQIFFHSPCFITHLPSAEARMRLAQNAPASQ
jgi:hypothetical protein